MRTILAALGVALFIVTIGAPPAAAAPATAAAVPAVRVPAAVPAGAPAVLATAPTKE